MKVQEQITKYITSQPEPKRSDMRELHRLTLQVSPECKLWFSYDINLENLFRLQRFFMASMRRPRLVGLSQA